MKFFKTIKKNFKVLFRLKTSLIAIIFGPLLVIFLIGFAFNSSNAIQITIGYNAPDNSTLTTDFISSLNEKYTLKEFQEKETCIKELEHGLIHTCIFFPEDFKIAKDKENNITFVVDKSRVNIAYTVIEKVSDQIGIKSDELSRDLTSTLTNTITKTGTAIDSTIGSLIKIKKDMNDNIQDANAISSDLNGIELDVKSYSFKGDSAISTIGEDINDIQDEVSDLARDYIPIIEDLNTSGTSSIVNAIKEVNNSVFDKYNSSTEQLSNLIIEISNLKKELDKLETQMETAKENTDNSRNKINDLQERLDELNDEVDTVKGKLESISRDINAIEITSSDQITNPISTTIQTISSDNNQLITLLPYLLILIIMFVGLMLSSSLVVVEKSSRAFFRVFTTPTKDEFFILTTFVTSFIIVAIQMSIILIAINYFLVDIFSQNLLTNITILTLASSIFIMLGMAIGYLITSQQAANMSSISIGALFLMVSNFVLPIESIIPALQIIAKYNPYVLASETLRKSTIFSTSLSEMMSEIGILLCFTIIIFMIIIIVQKISKAKYFNKQHSRHKKPGEKKGLWIKNILVNNEKEFIQEIQKMSKEDYKTYILKNRIKVSRFVKNELKKDKLAKKISKLTKEDLLKEIIKEKKDILEEIKKKHEKRTKEKQQKQ